MAKCLILKKLGIEIKKRLAADNSNTSAARVTSDSSSTATPTPTPTPPLASDTGGGSVIIPGACMASTEAETYDSGDDFDYEGKYEGAFYVGSVKPSQPNSHYSLDPHSCSYTSSEAICNTTPGDTPTICTNSSCTAVDPKGVTTICLPKHIMALLNNPPVYSIRAFSDAHRPQTSHLVANTGATDHMIPVKSASLYHIAHVRDDEFAWAKFFCTYLEIGHCYHLPEW
jgi:hypothetical protein